VALSNQLIMEFFIVKIPYTHSTQLILSEQPCLTGRKGKSKYIENEAKRLMTQITPNIGHLITDDAARRDAIHIAVAPVIAGMTLLPGQHVGFLEDRRIGIVEEKNRIGIVDPFLIDPVQEDQQFWLFMYPGTITSLRHVWTHPAFTIKIPGAKE
jgi:hypothetical protein